MSQYRPWRAFASIANMVEYLKECTSGMDGLALTGVYNFRRVSDRLTTSGEQTAPTWPSRRQPGSRWQTFIDEALAAHFQSEQEVT